LLWSSKSTVRINLSQEPPALEVLTSDEMSRHILHCNSGLPTATASVVATGFEMVIEIDQSNSLAASIATFKLTSSKTLFPLSYGYPRLFASPTFPKSLSAFTPDPLLSLASSLVQNAIPNPLCVFVVLL
jgi:hypothetical protein